MSAPPMDVPSTLVDGWDRRVMTDAGVAELARRFPGVVVWFGAATRQWWALVEVVAGFWRLMAADGLYDLSRLIESVRMVAVEATSVSARPAMQEKAPSGRPRGSSRGGRHARGR